MSEEIENDEEQNVAHGNSAIGRQVNSYGIPPEVFAEYARKLAVTEAALASFFKILGENQVPPGDVDGKLREIADNYNELLQRLQKEKASGKKRKSEQLSITTEKNAPLSIEYIQHITVKNEKIKIALAFIVGLFFVIKLHILSFALSCFIAIVLTKEQLIKYRIKKGLFGTNRTEARELLDFIIKNSDNLDFTDSNGNLRRALLPEAKDAAEEHIPGTLGEEAPV